MGFAFPLLQWLLRTVSPYSAADYPTVLEIRVSIPQSGSVSVYIPRMMQSRRKGSPKASHTCSMGSKSEENASQSIQVIYSLSSSLITPL
ncbi:hypothetical protein TNCV_4308471 [Trichonephila clavipes]|nr:hypothetical protein TNCV_4308471 [Trichonephila clavipes]